MSRSTPHHGSVLRRLTAATAVILLLASTTGAQTPFRVKDINPGANDSIPFFVRGTTGTAFFRACDSATGCELWRSDGTAAGTTLVKDLNPGPGHGVTFDLVDVDGTIFFLGDDGTAVGTELWKSDGTAAGTVLVKDIVPTPFGGSFGLGQARANVNGVLFFGASDGSIGDGANLELWKSDGTAAGTVRVKDINPGPDASFPSRLTNVNGTLLFSAFDLVNGSELWRSDGTTAGTVLVKDIWPGGLGSGPLGLTNVNGTLFFTANDGTSGKELWKSNGTAAGTVLVKDINPGAGGAFGSDFQYAESLRNVGGTLFFTADDGTSGMELWRSDGTAAGTVRVKDINPGAGASFPPNSFGGGAGLATTLTDVSGTLYFAATDGVNGAELWKSDGTDAGTVMVANINPGAAHAFPVLTPGFDSNFSPVMRAVSGQVFFAATDGTAGVELWRSDGTAGGTVRVGDIRPGAAGSYPKDLTTALPFLLFGAFDGTSGEELWAVDVCALLPDCDGDGFPNATDNCPARFNPDQRDSDRADQIAQGLPADGGDVCDACPSLARNVNPTTLQLECTAARTVGATVGGPAGECVGGAKHTTTVGATTTSTCTVETPDGLVAITVPLEPAPRAFDQPTSVSATGLTQGTFSLQTSQYVVHQTRLQPENVTFGTPLTVTFGWKNKPSDPAMCFVDNGTAANFREGNLQVYRTESAVTAAITRDCRGTLTNNCAAGPCGTGACIGGTVCQSACCNVTANTYTVDVTRFSDYAVAALCAPAGPSVLRLGRLDTPGGDDRISFRGSFIRPADLAQAAPLDPAATGLELALQDDGGDALNVTLLGGAFNPVTGVGWKTSASGTGWRYIDNSATPAGGITRVRLGDRSRRTPGLVDVAFSGRNGSYGVTAAAVAARVVLPDTLECYVASFVGPPPEPVCVADAAGRRLRCR